jgi:hypothetical protein
LCVNAALRPGEHVDVIPVAGDAANVVDSVCNEFCVRLGIIEELTWNVEPDWIGVRNSCEEWNVIADERLETSILYTHVSIVIGRE